MTYQNKMKQNENFQITTLAGLNLIRNIIQLRLVIRKYIYIFLELKVITFKCLHV